MNKELRADVLKNLGYHDLIKEVESRVEPVWNLPVVQLLDLFPDSPDKFSDFTKDLQGSTPTTIAESVGVDVPESLRANASLDIKLDLDNADTEWLDSTSTQIGSATSRVEGRNTPLLMDLEFMRKVWLSEAATVDEQQRMVGSLRDDKKDIWNAFYRSGSDVSERKFSLELSANSQIGKTLLAKVATVLGETEGRLGGFGYWTRQFNNELLNRQDNLPFKPDLKFTLNSQAGKEGKGALRIDVPVELPVGHVARSVAELTWVVKPDFAADQNGVNLLRMDKPHSDKTKIGNQALWEFINDLVVKKNGGEIEFAEGDDIDKLLAGNAWAYIWRG